MIKTVISNQKGGVAKTTTTVTLARELADNGYRVLIVDTDPQGSVGSLLGLKPEYFLANFVVNGRSFESCVVKAHPSIDVMCSDRATVQAESYLLNLPGREMAFSLLFKPCDSVYDAVLIDVAPSINMMQTCAMVYAQQLLIPVSMDTLSVQGALAALSTAESMNSLYRVQVRPLAFLPVMMDKRFQMTAVVMESLQACADRFHVPLLPSIRTDQAVARCSRARSFLADFDPKSKALEDYRTATAHLMRLLHVEPRSHQAQETATA